MMVFYIAPSLCIILTTVLKIILKVRDIASATHLPQPGQSRSE